MSTTSILRESVTINLQKMIVSQLTITLPLCYWHETCGLETIILKFFFHFPTINRDNIKFLFAETPPPNDVFPHVGGNEYYSRVHGHKVGMSVTFSFPMRIYS